MTAVAVICIGSLMAFSLRRNFAAYQFVLLASFVVALTISGELLDTFPLYALASIVPLVFVKKRYSPLAILYILAMAIYCLAGVLFQHPYAAVTVFLSRSLQFIAFFIVLENVKARKPPTHAIRIVAAAVVVESVVGVYLRLTGEADLYGHIRLVSNAQPITGNIAVFVMPLVGWLYYRGGLSSGARLGLLSLSTVLLFWVILSGTRGYILLFGGCYAILVVDALLDKSGGKNWGKAGLFVLFAMLATVVFLCGVYQERAVLAVEEILGTNVSLGVRGQENQVEALFFAGAPLVTKILGIGTGGAWADYPSYVAAVQEVFGDEPWALSSYGGKVGTAFHNYYADTLGLEGVLGIALLVGVVVSMLHVVWSTTQAGEGGRRRRLCIFLTAYVALFFLMLYYRWSADCGVGELIMLAYVFNLCRLEGESNGLHDCLRPSGATAHIVPSGQGTTFPIGQGLRRSLSGFRDDNPLCLSFCIYPVQLLVRIEPLPQKLIRDACSQIVANKRPYLSLSLRVRLTLCGFSSTTSDRRCLMNSSFSLMVLGKL